MKDMSIERHDFEHLLNEVNSLRRQFSEARERIVPRRVISVAVQNYIANTLSINKGDIVKMIEERLRSIVHDWIHHTVDRTWLKKLISEVVVAELRPLVAGKFAVKVEDEGLAQRHLLVVTVTESK